MKDEKVKKIKILYDEGKVFMTNWDKILDSLCPHVFRLFQERDYFECKIVTKTLPG